MKRHIVYFLVGILCMGLLGSLYAQDYTEDELIYRSCPSKLSLILEYTNQAVEKLACVQTTQITTPTTITNPGYYCLNNDIVGTITINSDRVILDLNGFEISGTTDHVIVVEHTDIVIKNGIIRGTTTGSSGISVTDGINITIENINFTDNYNGILLTTVSCIAIEQCMFTEHTKDGSCINATGLYGAHFSDIVCKNNTSNQDIALINLLNADTVSLERITLNNNVLQNNSFNIGSFGGGLTLISSSNLFLNAIAIDENFGPSSGFGIICIGLALAGVHNVYCQDCTVNNNVSDVLFIGVLTAPLALQGNSNLTFKNCYANNNSSNSNAVEGFEINRCTHLTMLDCQANNNSGSTSTGFTYGFALYGGPGSDILYKGCSASGNSGRTVGGFTFSFAADNFKGIFQECIANDNTAVLTAYGFEFQQSSTSCVVNCIAKRNSGGTAGYGIYLNSTASFEVDSNLVVGNSTTGIENVSGVANVFFSNKAQENGTLGANNYSGVPTTQIITYDIGLADFTTTNTRPFINLAIQP
ncbi:MAG: right-handed parallel beta-helix repeat-containing protein [Candidatus Babeliales bacterium]